MKLCVVLISLLTAINCSAQDTPRTENVFIITIDGFRWQEVFRGADPELVRNTQYVQDTNLLCRQYWDEDPDVRRGKLLPFFWNVIATQGRLSGNRDYDNDMNVSNLYKISYPGYSEIFTGYADSRFIPNLQVRNRNGNLLSYLNTKDSFRGKIAAFTSWNVLPFVLNETAGEVPVNSGYEMLEEGNDTLHILINEVQNSVVHKSSTRQDQLTFASAKNYITKNHPRVLFLGLGETDEYAHKGAYDRYLQKAHQVDEMIAELWYMVQTDPFYKDHTTLIITTDHGRGQRASSWSRHGFWVKGSGEAWLAMLGAGIKPEGEQRNRNRIYLKQIAATVSGLLGEKFAANHPVSKQIELEK